MFICFNVCNHDMLHSSDLIGKALGENLLQSLLNRILV